MAPKNTQTPQPQSNATQPQPTAATQAPPELFSTGQSNNPLAVPEGDVKSRVIQGEAAKKALVEGQIGENDTVKVKTKENPSGEIISPAELVARTKMAGGVNRVFPGFGGVKNPFDNIVSAQVKSTKLIDAKGNLARDQYNPDDAYLELRKLSLSNRRGLLNELFKRGFYPNDRGPSETGLDSGSQAAMEQFLGIVNDKGYTWDVAQPLVFAEYEPVKGLPGTGGRARSYQVSSPDDITLVANRVAEEIIGRRLTKGQAEKIIKMVQSEERKAGLSDAVEQVQAAAPQTIAQQQVEQTFSQEAQMMRMASAGRIMEEAMRNL
jgi:hypothetical protein